jgi:lipopolysaccharide export LptBFGC system permease protein LptF
VVYLVLPLSVLVATLVTLSLLTKSSQIIAMKSAGVSLYRVALPVALAAVVASGLMFFMNDRYLPAANQRQDVLRRDIQGSPVQTVFRTGWQWIFGRSNRIYNYRFFDPYHDIFANLSVFDFDASFHITRRIYAQRAFWEPHLGLTETGSRSTGRFQLPGFAISESARPISRRKSEPRNR